MALALLFLPGLAYGREVVFPPDGALVTEEIIQVLGYRAPENGPGKLALVTRDHRQEKVVKPGEFSVTFKLYPGVNSISLDKEYVKIYFAPGKVNLEAKRYRSPDLHAVDNVCDDCHATQEGVFGLSAEGPELCASCHDDVAAGQDGQPHAALHPPVEDGECLECHVFHGIAVTSLPAAELMALCFGCHDDFREGDGVAMHPPAEEGECFECHDPHGSANASLLTLPAAELCLQCHDDPGVDENGEEWGVAHPALEEGCPACHQPHSAGQETLLKNEMAPLCAECHDDMTRDGEGNEWAAAHSPVEEGSCTECHLPHGSAQGGLLIQEVPALCSECHDDKTLDDEGGEWATAHPPVEEGSCTECHLPHGSAVSGMLNMDMPKLCAECHEDKRLDGDGEDWAVVHPPVMLGTCTECHPPHGSAQGGLLIQEIPILCSACHDNKNVDGDGNEWVTAHEPMLEGDCMQCHLPHGSPETAMLPVIINDLCEGCHSALHARHLATVDIDEYEDVGTSSVPIPPEDFPMIDDERFLCTGCHLPHGSNNTSLWPDTMDMFCATCHKV